jgi:hypothetical protein
MNRSQIDTFKAATKEKNAGRSGEAESEAEERAINYLATLPVDVARGAAVKAAMWFFAVLEAETQKTLVWRDPSRADLIAADERAMIGADLARYIKYVLCQPYPDECIRELLEGLTPLGAAFVALALVDHVCSSERIP